MSRTCIICGDTAGSKEHTFPAAFGGRRVNKKIYCERHNNQLGVHVVSLLRALEYFNAALGVRSDHRSSPKPHTVEVEAGDRYQILRDKFEFAPPPPIKETEEILGGSATLKFASKAQFREWEEQQRRDGYRIEVLAENPPQTQYFSEPVKLTIDLGGEEFRRAVAYVGLTYLAHHFPAVAAQPGLSSIKSCVLGKEPVEDRVWWLKPNEDPISERNGFRAIHFVSVVIDRAGRAYAQVGFFGKLCFSVDLGLVEAAQPVSIVTYINPLAESAAPDVDVKVECVPEGSIYLGSSEEGKEYVSNIIGGKVANPIATVLVFLQEEHLGSQVSKLLPMLEAASGKSKVDCDLAAAAIVEDQSQRVFNLLHIGVSEFLELYAGLPESIRDVLEKSIAGNAESPSGLSSEALVALERGKARLSSEVSRLLVSGQLTESRLRSLLAGGEGVAVVVRPVLESIVNSL